MKRPYLVQLPQLSKTKLGGFKMNRNMAEKQEMEKEGLVKRLLTAAAKKLFAGFCVYEIGLSPYETQLFMNYSSFGWEDALMAQSLISLKMDEEV